VFEMRRICSNARPNFRLIICITFLFEIFHLAWLIRKRKSCESFSVVPVDEPSFSVYSSMTKLKLQLMKHDISRI